jgi:hypothetical protein
MIMRWGSPLVQETYREERGCDKRHDDNNNNNNINFQDIENKYFLVLMYS